MAQRPANSSRPASAGRPRRVSDTQQSVKSAKVTGQAPRQRSAAASQQRAATSRPRSQAGRPVTSRPQPRSARTEYRPIMRIPLGDIQRRLTFGLVVLAVLVAGATLRLIQVQGFDSRSYAEAAAAQVQRVRTLPAVRGGIYDANGRVLAQTQAAVDVIADPLAIVGESKKSDDPTKVEARARKIAEVLVTYLGETVEYYVPLLLDTTKQHYSVLKRQVTAAKFRELATALNEAELGGIYRLDNPIRNYPNGASAGSIVGFLNSDKEGAAGIEYALNRQLSGVAGEEAYAASAYGRIPLAGSVLKPALNGTNYTLTINADVQQMLELSLADAIARTGGKVGFAITMDVTTGEVIALANNPSYDPANFAKAQQSDLGNRAVQMMYEPGSVVKLLTVAALEDQGLINPDTQIVVPAQVQSGEAVIKDAFDHGTINLTARGVIAKSSNVGTVEMGRKLSREKYLEYVTNFGLGQPTGIELPGEAAGSVNAQMSSFDLDRAFFGQAMSVTGIQMAAAVAAIANGGVYNQPTIIKSAVDGNGKQIPLQRAQPRRVISQQASTDVLNMMEGMISSTNGVLDMANFRQGGKTGTSQRYSESCGCYPPGSWTMSFVDVAPIENPRYLTYMVVDEPTAGVNSGHTMVAPAVRDFMKFLLPYMGVPMSTGPLRKDPLTW
ncbi:MAG: peptidoglycan D,D-transpeptidase FtsI family protein [Propionibacteriaceae bacterium]